MDYGTFRGLYTLLLMIIMIGIIVWAVIEGSEVIVGLKAKKSVTI